MEAVVACWRWLHCSGELYDSVQRPRLRRQRCWRPLLPSTTCANVAPLQPATHNVCYQHPQRVPVWPRLNQHPQCVATPEPATTACANVATHQPASQRMPVWPHLNQHPHRVPVWPHLNQHPPDRRPASLHSQITPRYTVTVMELAPSRTVTKRLCLGGLCLLRTTVQGAYIMPALSWK